MPNRNYERGRRKEYKICEQLKEEGFDIVQRTAGSHSPIDIIAINKSTNEIRFIQSKPNNYSKNKENELINNNSWLTNRFNCKFVVV